MVVSPTVSQPVSQYNLAAKPPSCHDTPIRIATQSPSSQALAHAPLTHARGPAVSQGLSVVSWPKHAMSWPLQQCPAALCHDTIHCIVTQMGSSPSSLCFFFFFFSFFFLIPATGKPPKKIFFFSFSSRTKNIFLKYFIYFIIIFSCFTHCKTKKKKIFNTPFFFF